MINDGKQEEAKKCDKGKYEPMSDDEIKKLAEDMYKGLIFTNGHLERQEDMQSVFLPLALAGEELIDELVENPPGMIYEYMDKAGPMAINGMPIFTSFRMVSIDDTKKVFGCYNKIKEAIAKV